MDPLALVQAIERYLLSRGYGSASDGGEQSDRSADELMLMGDEESEDEIEVDEDDEEEEDMASSRNSPNSASGTGTMQFFDFRTRLCSRTKFLLTVAGCDLRG